MTPEQVVTIIVGVLNAGAVSGFAWHLIRGLKTKIAALEGTIAAQNKTLEIMERQVVETEKVGGIYKNLFSELPAQMENYKAVISKSKDDVILELKNSNKEKEERIKQLAETESKLAATPATDRGAVKHLETMRFLLSKDREHFKNFVEKVCGDIDVAVEVLIPSTDFESFLKLAGRTLSIEDSKDAWDALVAANGKDGGPRMSQGLWSHNGWWGLFDDEKIVMSTGERNRITAAIRALSVKLASLP